MASTRKGTRRKRRAAPGSRQRCRNLYRFIRACAGDQPSDRELARRWGMEWRSFAALKQGRRQVPRVHELERLAALLGVPPAFVYQVANGVPPDEVAALLAREQALRAELEAERRTLQLLFEHVPAACLVFERDGTISRAGGPVEKCCPAAAAALVGRKASEVFGDPGPAGCPVTRAFLSGRTEQQVSRLRDAGGRWVYVHRTAGPIVRDGRVAQVIEVMVDVGEQMRAGDLRVVSLWLDQPAEGPSASPVERRGLPRVDTEFAAEILAAGRRFDVRVLNLSPQGVCLAAGIPVSVGDEIDLSWRLPTDNVLLRARGVVVWQRANAPSSGIGVRLVDVARAAG